MFQYFPLLKNNNIFNFSDLDKKHIIKIVCLKEGEKVLCVFEKIFYLCEINYLNKKDVIGKILKTLTINNELKNKITVIFPILKNKKHFLILQKLTELGVKKFVPFLFSNCDIKKQKYKSTVKKQNELFKQILLDSSKQSHRNIIPTVSEIIFKLNDLKKFFSEFNLLPTLKINNNIYIDSFKNLIKNSSITFVIGPEGGLSESEIIFFKENNFNLVKLSKTILRSETAAIFTASLLYNLINEK